MTASYSQLRVLHLESQAAKIERGTTLERSLAEGDRTFRFVLHGANAEYLSIIARVVSYAIAARRLVDFTVDGWQFVFGEDHIVAEGVVFMQRSEL